MAFFHLLSPGNPTSNVLPFYSLYYLASITQVARYVDSFFGRLSFCPNFVFFLVCLTNYKQTFQSPKYEITERKCIVFWLLFNLKGKLTDLKGHYSDPDYFRSWRPFLAILDEGDHLRHDPLERRQPSSSPGRVLDSLTSSP